MNSKTEAVYDGPHLTIVRVEAPGRRPRYLGEALLDRIEEAEVREIARDCGLVLTMIDIFSPQREGVDGWVQMQFLPLEVP